MSRIPRHLLALLACACGPAEPSLDSGLMPPSPKDVGSTAEDSGGQRLDAGDADAGTFAPDAAPLPDRDGDGLPDARDPAPDSPNRVLFSDDFSAANPAWLLTNSGMRAERGAMRVDITDAVVREGWLGPQPNWTDVLVHSEFRLSRRGRSDDPGAGRGAIMVRVLQVVPDRYLTCGVDARLGTAFLTEHAGGNSAGRVVAEGPLPGALGERHDITMAVEGTRFVCTVSGVRLEATSGLYTSGSVGLRAHDVVFEAEHITVYAL